MSVPCQSLLFVSPLLFLFAAADDKAADDPAATIAAQVKLWQPTPDERRFDDIGWAPDILAARRLAREHKRPVFLFTHDGHMAVGRC
ncbi:MAG: hypothetical protein U0793_06970 [Gemmataceae bacterium]